jgi:AbrB family looped-hinge helix DNA binding protein
MKGKKPKFFKKKRTSNTFVALIIARGSMLSKEEKQVEAVLMGQSKITLRGQVTVPMEIRRKFRLKPGDTLCFLEVDGSIVLKLGPLVLTE